MISKEAKENLIQFLEDREHLDVPGNSLLIYHKGEEIFRHFSGSTKEDTLFRIYSMTKVATVTAALQLYEQGKFTMDDPVYWYLPSYKDIKVWNAELGKAEPAKNVMRMKDLFCMSTGLTYEGEWGETPKQLLAIRQRLEAEHPGESFTTLEYASAMAEAALMFEPGTRWAYGLSHDVLGAVIEVLSGDTLGEYMRKHIFEPLGMKNTFFRCPDELRDRIAEHPTSEQDDAKFRPTAKYEAGGGGLLSTTDDYMKLARTLTLGGTSPEGVKILGRKTIDLLRMDHLNAEQKQDFNWDYLKGYSYGLGVRTLVDPAAAGVPGTVGEFGWCGVLGTWVLMDPEEELTVVYMHQRYPNLEAYVQIHLRQMIYSLI